MGRWSPTVLPDITGPEDFVSQLAEGYARGVERRRQRERDAREQTEFDAEMRGRGGMPTEEYRRGQGDAAAARKTMPPSRLTLLPGVGFIPDRTAAAMATATAPRAGGRAAAELDPMAAEAKMRPQWARPYEAGDYTVDPAIPMQRERYGREQAAGELTRLYQGVMDNPQAAAPRASLYARVPALADNDPTMFPRASGGLSLEQRQQLLDYTETLRRQRDERRNALQTAATAQRNAARAVDAQIENVDKRISVLMRRMDGERNETALGNYNRELAVLQDERTRLSGEFVEALRAGAEAPSPREPEPLPAPRPAAPAPARRPGGPRPPPARRP